MQDFDPGALFAIMQETLGDWFWPLVALAVVLLAGALSGAWRLRRAAGPFRRPVLAAALIGAVVTALALWSVPGWSGAAPGSFNGAIDWLAALALALVPGAAAAALVFSLATRRCARRVQAADGQRVQHQGQA